MKGKASIGFFTVFLLVGFMASISAGADPPPPAPPKYDATGTWDFQTSNAWTDCCEAPLEGDPGTFKITQTGSTFTLQAEGAPASLSGSVIGSTYRVFTGQHYDELATTQSIIFELVSASVANGLTHVQRIYDTGVTCSMSLDLHLQKRGDCTPSDTVMCLRNGRFSISVEWADEHGATGVGHAVPATDDSGLFWFFSNSNMELLIKVLDGCLINDRYWVFFAGTTDQAFTVTVKDLESSQMVEYTNPLKNPADAVTDTSAFATCPFY
jgi:hypothetical protein